MTFTNFLQVLAFNLLSNTIPLCLMLLGTSYMIFKMCEKRIIKGIWKEAERVVKEQNKNV